VTYQHLYLLCRYTKRAVLDRDTGSRN